MLRKMLGGGQAKVVRQAAGQMVERLEDRRMLALTSTGVDPANMGKGDWIWQISSAQTNTGTSSVQGLVDYLKAKGMQWIIVKAGDGNAGPIYNYAADSGTAPTNGSWTQFNKDLIETFHRAGIKIFGYQFTYGGGDPSPKTAVTTPEGEKQVARDIMSLGPDGLVIDAEGTWERLTNADAIAEDYCQSFRALYPKSFLAHAPFPYVSLHSSFPYYAFGKYCDVVMPQDYWKTISIAQTPEKMVTDMNREYKALYDQFRANGQEDAIKPIVPIAQGYDPSSTKITPGSEVTTFVNLLNSDTSGTSPGGYNGVSFWSVQHHTSSIWDAVGSASIGTTGAQVQGYVFNDKNGDGIRQSKEEALPGRTVYVDLNNNKKMDAADVRAVTDSNGWYNLFFLPSGSYIIRQKLPAGWRQTLPALNYGWHVTVSDGQVVTGKDLGATVKPLVMGVVYNDANVNGKRDAGEVGIPNIRVFDDLNLDGSYDEGEPRAYTDSTGTYRLTTPTGSVRVGETVPGSMRLVKPSGGYHDLSIYGRAPIITDVNFGNTTRVLIRGAVFLDANVSQGWESNEPGLANWTVYVDSNNNGALDASEPSTLTGEDGRFRFARLNAGTYVLRVVQPSKYRLTMPVAGSYLIKLGKGNSFGGAYFGEKRIA